VHRNQACTATKRAPQNLFLRCFFMDDFVEKSNALGLRRNKIYEELDYKVMRGVAPSSGLCRKWFTTWQELVNDPELTQEKAQEFFIKGEEINSKLADLEDAVEQHIALEETALGGQSSNSRTSRSHFDYLKQCITEESLRLENMLNERLENVVNTELQN